MPTGTVKWYDADKGFGFLSRDDGLGDVYVHASALPAGAQPKQGARVEFGVAEGRRGEQALAVALLDPLPSVAAAQRRPAEELHGLVEDTVKLLESKVQPDLRRNRYPDKATGKRIAQLLRAIADELEG